MPRHPAPTSQGGGDKERQVVAQTTRVWAHMFFVSFIYTNQTTFLVTLTTTNDSDAASSSTTSQGGGIDKWAQTTRFDIRISPKVYYCIDCYHSDNDSYFLYSFFFVAFSLGF